MKRVLILAMVALTISACGQQMKLQDDPDNEPTSLSVGAPPPTGTTPATPTPVPNPTTPSQDEAILQLYAHVDPNHLVATSLLSEAILYFHKNKASIENQKYLSVIDFSKSSTEARFYIMNIETGSVWAIHVAHGKNSDPDHDGYATSFSNTNGSNQSSLGFYKTAETYEGAHGLSLRLDGLSATNSNVRDRAVVIHGADYVQEASVIQGRSWGCPAVAMENRDAVVNRLKNGSLIFAGLSKK